MIFQDIVELVVQPYISFIIFQGIVELVVQLYISFIIFQDIVCKNGAKEKELKNDKRSNYILIKELQERLNRLQEERQTLRTQLDKETKEMGIKYL